MEQITGLIHGLILNAILTAVTVFLIWFSERISPRLATGIVQAGMLIKIMLGVFYTLLVFKFGNIDEFVYTVTVGVYVCIIMPIITYFTVTRK